MYIHAHVQIHLLHVYIQIYVHTNICTYKYIHTNICTYVMTMQRYRTIPTYILILHTNTCTHISYIYFIYTYEHMYKMHVHTFYIYISYIHCHGMYNVTMHIRQCIYVT